jgi:hypothetical protein
VLDLVAQDGTREEAVCDHVLAATGYHSDIERLDFLAPRIKERLRVRSGYPLLSFNFESSVPGLYFVGPLASYSYGPAMRFVFGAVHPARRLSRHLSKVRSRGVPGAASPISLKST